MSLLSTPKVAVAITLIVLTVMIVPQVFSQTFLVVTVATDKTQYVPGETVTIFGNVTDNQGNPVVGAAVSIEVNEPPIYVQLVSSNQSGAYSNQFALSDMFSQGNYTVFVSAHEGNFTATQHTQFIVLPKATSNTSTTSSASISSTQQTTPPSQCFIATATYGSEVAPEVTLLRNFRDREIVQTLAGKNFMLEFNAFYYSFSPRVASYISSDAALRGSMKVLLYPLIGILYASDRIFAALSYNGEFAVAVAGIFAATGIGLVYFGPILLVIRKIGRVWRVENSTFMMSFALCVAALLGLVLGESLRDPMILMVSAVGTVLSFTFLGGTLTLCFARMAENARKGWRKTA